MDYIKVTSENIEKEHICCAISNNNDIQVSSKRDILLQETAMLDYNSPAIQDLVCKRRWNELDDFNKIKQIYNYVRDEIKFGYNIDDSVPASRVLKDGYGQCNTKGTLFMALLRRVDIPCRVHGFTIDKKLQKASCIL